MKLRLGLVVLSCLPLLVNGQVPDKTGVKFYSKGKMYVKYKDGVVSADKGKTSSTTLYIDGSAKFVDGAGIVQAGRTNLTGDFVNAINPATANSTPNLFAKTDLSVDGTLFDGVVAFVGQFNKQTIKSVGVANTELQKQKNFIAFPTLRIEKAVNDVANDPRLHGHVAVEPTAAVMVDYLSVDANNRFSVEGTYLSANASRKLDVGQALIKNVNAADAQTLATYSQVKLDLYNKADQGFGTNNVGNTSSNTLRNAAGENYLTGFTVPFQKMGADYFFYHTLTVPDGTSVTSNEGPMTDPHHVLQAGKGYFMSMDVTDEDYAQIDTDWNLSHTKRAQGGLTFSRKIYEDFLSATGGPMEGFSRFNYQGSPIAGSIPTKHDVITEEKFTTAPVTVSLKKGLNFLGNPFMAPISLNYILGLPYKYVTSKQADIANYAGVDDTTNESVGGFNASKLLKPAGAPKDIFISGGTQNDAAQNMLRSKYWVINNATVKYKGNNTLGYKVTYDYVSRNGGLTTSGIQAGTGTGTSIVGTPADYLIAPMQMFCLQANNDFDISLSPDLRTFGTTNFLKSTDALNKNAMADFIVVEVENTVDKTTDRTAVVLKESSKMNADAYDTSKGLTKQIDKYVAVYNGKNTRTYPEVTTSVVYTKSNDGVDMLGNVVPTNIKELALYVTPPATPQAMKLKFHNLENMISAPNVWLVDKYENNKTVKLTSDYVYEFTSSPSDLNKTESRFILRFYATDSENPTTSKEEQNISSFYSGSILIVSGLNDKDENSNLQIYDMQGRLMGTTKVNNITSDGKFQYLKPLSLGTYIVKVTGNRNFAAKFVNLQN